MKMVQEKSNKELLKARLAILRSKQTLAMDQGDRASCDQIGLEIDLLTREIAKLS